MAAPRLRRSGRTELNGLFAFGDYLLVCRPDFPAHHAYQVAQTLAVNAGLIAGARFIDASASPIALHPGARAYVLGEPMPPPLARAGGEILPDHVH